MEFEVTPAVLIPRPETETLVEAAVEFLKDLPEPLVADIGTGSGAIAVAIAGELPRAVVYATEVSLLALRTAGRNARRHLPPRRVRLMVGDGLAPILESGLKGTLDAVCANPPYIPTHELPGLQPELAYEPTIALDGGEDGLAAYRSLAPQSVEALRPGGRLLVEVGAGQSEAVRDLLTEAGLSIAGTRRDLQGTERVVVAGRPR